MRFPAPPSRRGAGPSAHTATTPSSTIRAYVGRRVTVQAATSRPAWRARVDAPLVDRQVWRRSPRQSSSTARAIVGGSRSIALSQQRPAAGQAGDPSQRRGPNDETTACSSSGPRPPARTSSRRPAEVLLELDVQERPARDRREDGRQRRHAEPLELGRAQVGHGLRAALDALERRIVAERPARRRATRAHRTRAPSQPGFAIAARNAGIVFSVARRRQSPRWASRRVRRPRRTSRRTGSDEGLARPVTDRSRGRAAARGGPSDRASGPRQPAGRRRAGSRSTRDRTADPDVVEAARVAVRVHRRRPEPRRPRHLGLPAIRLEVRGPEARPPSIRA